LGLLALGFLFSRLPVCSRFAIANLHRGLHAGGEGMSILMITDESASWEVPRRFYVGRAAFRCERG
jgi:hypothetical protein